MDKETEIKTLLEITEKCQNHIHNKDISESAVKDYTDYIIGIRRLVNMYFPVERINLSRLSHENFRNTLKMPLPVKSIVYYSNDLYHHSVLLNGFTVDVRKYIVSEIKYFLESLIFTPSKEVRGLCMKNIRYNLLK